MNTDQSPSDVHDYLAQSEILIQKEYQRIRKRTLEDPGTAGDQGEENWAAFMRAWLPAMFPVVTKGRILTHDGYASPQIDLLILSPSYPPALIDKKLYLASGVLAAFECKTTLRYHHIAEAVQTFAEIRRHITMRVGSPHLELCSTLISGLLAHSHDWSSPPDKVLEIVTNGILEADNKYVRHPRECLDLLTISDLGTWFTWKGIEYRDTSSQTNSSSRVKQYDYPYVVSAPFCFSPFNPKNLGCKLALGPLVQELFNLLTAQGVGVTGLSSRERHPHASIAPADPGRRMTQHHITSQPTLYLSRIQLFGQITRKTDCRFIETSAAGSLTASRELTRASMRRVLRACTTVRRSRGGSYRPETDNVAGIAACRAPQSARGFGMSHMKLRQTKARKEDVYTVSRNQGKDLRTVDCEIPGN